MRRPPGGWGVVAAGGPSGEVGGRGLIPGPLSLDSALVLVHSSCSMWSLQHLSTFSLRNSMVVPFKLLALSIGDPSLGSKRKGRLAGLFEKSVLICPKMHDFGKILLP